MAGKMVLAAGSGAAGVVAANNGLLDDLSLDKVTGLMSEVRFRAKKKRP